MDRGLVRPSAWFMGDGDDAAIDPIAGQALARLAR